MRQVGLAAIVAALSIAGMASTAHAIPPNVAQAVSDTARPPADRDLDAARKPAELLDFVGIAPGQKIVDVFPGPYFDRMFSTAVGPTGKVFMFIPTEAVKVKDAPDLPTGTKPFADHPNIVVQQSPINAFSVPESVDVVWIRQNYHDLYDPFMGPADVPAFNKSVFKALKPGGLYIVIDHSGPDGTGLASTNTTHRIDAAVVKRDMAAAGFVFEGESDTLRNPADPRTALVFDKSIRGHTDQFVYKFRKPR